MAIQSSLTTKSRKSLKDNLYSFCNLFSRQSPRKQTTIILLISLLGVFFCCCFFTSILLAVTWNDPVLSLISPETESYESFDPEVVIKLSCSNIDEIYLNNNILDKTDFTLLCGETGKPFDLDDGTNYFAFRGIKIVDFNDKDTSLNLDVLFDKERYDKEIARVLGEQTDILLEEREELLSDLQNTIDDAPKYNMDTSEYQSLVESVDEEDHNKDLEQIQENINSIDNALDNLTDDLKTEEETTYKVISITDGDTIKISYKGNIESVRLIGIDTPETKHPSKAVECFGEEATQKMEKLLENKRVNINFDPSQAVKDKYDRLLLYLWCESIFVNEYMVKSGYAYEYTYKVPYKYQSTFENLEKQAQEKKFGLWGNACKCEKGKEDNRKCVSCHKAEISYLNWDCSKYTNIATDYSCTTGCTTNNPPPANPPSTPSYTCNCSKTCGQMSSCEEAYFQLNTCGCRVRDGDNDGVPCESICPGG